VSFNMSCLWHCPILYRIPIYPYKHEAYNHYCAEPFVLTT
jgi:hypothetical protein